MKTICSLKSSKFGRREYGRRVSWRRRLTPAPASPRYLEPEIRGMQTQHTRGCHEREHGVTSMSWERSKPWYLAKMLPDPGQILGTLMRGKACFGQRKFTKIFVWNILGQKKVLKLVQKKLGRIILMYLIVAGWGCIHKIKPQGSFFC